VDVVVVVKPVKPVKPPCLFKFPKGEGAVVFGAPKPIPPAANKLGGGGEVVVTLPIPDPAPEIVDAVLLFGWKPPNAG
jgi:hypothetical protein